MISSISPSLLSVYPRVGGGTPIFRQAGRVLNAVYPRVGREGLSPRGRGNHIQRQWRGAGPGSIPAWAGEPSAFTLQLFQGLSPRGRGNPYFANTNKVGISPKPIIGTSPSLLSDG